MLAQNATIESLGDVIDKFAVTPLVNKKNGIVTQWTIDPETGKAVQNKTTLYVASNGSDSNTGLTSDSALASINKVIDKINALNDEEKDYIIEVNGEILGPQTIADTSIVFLLLKQIVE